MRPISHSIDVGGCFSTFESDCYNRLAIGGSPIKGKDLE